MGRRDADARPPIEILGADLGVSSTQQVALGPRRPEAGSGADRWPIAVGVVVAAGRAAWCSAAVTTTDGAAPQEERDNQERIDLDKPQTLDHRVGATTTTRPTTTTTLPVGPALRRAGGGRSCSSPPAPAGPWSTSPPVEVAPGPRCRPADRVLGSSRSAAGSSMPVGGEAAVLPGPRRREEPQPVPLGPADQVLTGGRRTGSGSSISRRRDGRRTRRHRRPARRPHRARCCGPSRSRGATSRRRDRGRGARVARRAGSTWPTRTASEPIAVGWTSAARRRRRAGDDAATTTASCALRRQPTDGGSRATLLAIDGSGRRCTTRRSTAPDGSVAAGGYADPRRRAAASLLFDPDGRAARPDRSGLASSHAGAPTAAAVAAG